MYQDRRISRSQTIAEIKQEQLSLSNTISEINERLAAVEQHTASLDNLQTDMNEAEENIHHLEKEPASFRARLDQMEDHSRRDNLIFFGIKDDATETPQQSEEKLFSLLSDKLDLCLTTDAIAGVHRIGRFNTKRNRPLIVKFSAYKTRELVFSKRSDFHDSDYSMSEDFCLTTRQARKHLLEYAKSLKTKYKLCYNKLITDGKW